MDASTTTIVEMLVALAREMRRPDMSQREPPSPGNVGTLTMFTAFESGRPAD